MSDKVFLDMCLLSVLLVCFVMLKPFEVEGLVRFQDLKGTWETDEFSSLPETRGVLIKFNLGMR